VVDFADGVHARVFALDAGAPGLPEGAGDVGHGVLADAVDAGAVDPPEGVLDLVAGEFGVVLVEVGKPAAEPAVERGRLGGGRSVRIGDRPDSPVIVEVMLGRAAVPGGSRWVVEPGVEVAAVVG